MRAREIEEREAKTMQILKDEKSARKKVLRVSRAYEKRLACVAALAETRESQS